MNTAASIVAFVAALWVFFGYVNPEYQGIKTLKQERAEYQAALASATEAEQVKIVLVSKYNGMDPAALERLSILLPDSVDPVKFIIELNNISTRAGMPIKDIAVLNGDSTNSTQPQMQGEAVPQFTGRANTYESISFQFSVTGTYENLLVFLTELEQNLRVVDISNLSIKYVKDKEYQYTFKVTTHWLK